MSPAARRDDEPLEGLDPLARELIRTIREHTDQETKINREGFAGLRSDLREVMTRVDKAQRSMLWLVGGVVIVAIVAVVAVAGGQISARALGATVSTTPATIADHPRP